MSLLSKVDQRSYGDNTKLYTWYFQGLSALIFVILSLLLPKNSPFFILFLFEGIGQLFLTLQNKNSLERGDYQVSYFKKSPLSNLALVSFTIVVGARFLLIRALLPEVELFLLVIAVISTLIWYFLFFKSSLRRDVLSGSFIVLSSLAIGALCIALDTDFMIGINFILYSLLILLGTLALKPWVAELINIILWIHLFALVI